MGKKICACGCDKEFEPNPLRPAHIYADSKCKKRAKHARHREERSAYHRRYYKKHRERRLAYQRRYYVEHREELVAQARLHRMDIKREMIEAYGGRCVCCGETAYEFLTIDHINGRKRGETSGGHLLYIRLKGKGWPRDNFRLLCLNCNFAIGKFGYCPHEERRRSS